MDFLWVSFHCSKSMYVRLIESKLTLRSECEGLFVLFVSAQFKYFLFVIIIIILLSTIKIFFAIIIITVLLTIIIITVITYN